MMREIENFFHSKWNHAIQVRLQMTSRDSTCQCTCPVCCKSAMKPESANFDK